MNTNPSLTRIGQTNTTAHKAGDKTVSTRNGTAAPCSDISHQITLIKVTQDQQLKERNKAYKFFSYSKMYNAPYPYYNLGKGSSPHSQSTQTEIYKFKARHRVYLVMFEIYEFGLVAVKYCDRKDKGARNAFTKVFNEKDSDAIRVISTCLNIMHSFWQKYPNANFSFIASQRAIPEIIFKRRNFDNKPQLIEGYKKIRFSIYKQAMFNLFNPEEFEHFFDPANCIYLLMNRREKNAEDIKKNMIDLLSHQYELFFDSVE